MCLDGHFHYCKNYLAIFTKFNSHAGKKDIEMNAMQSYMQ